MFIKNDIFEISPLKKSFFAISYKRKCYTSYKSYYHQQSLLPLSHAILQESKLLLLKTYLAFDRYMDKQKFNLLYTNTDSFLVCMTERNLFKLVYILT